MVWALATPTFTYALPPPIPIRLHPILTPPQAAAIGRTHAHLSESLPQMMVLLDEVEMDVWFSNDYTRDRMAFEAITGTRRALKAAMAAVARTRMFSGLSRWGGGRWTWRVVDVAACGRRVGDVWVHVWCAWGVVLRAEARGYGGRCWGRRGRALQGQQPQAARLRWLRGSLVAGAEPRCLGPRQQPGQRPGA